MARVRDDDFEQTRLLIEELCCDLCRFKHATEEGLPMDAVRIDREFFLGKPEAFADIRVTVGDHAPYFLEVKFKYSFEKLFSRLAFKFASASPAKSGEQKVVLVVDTEGRAEWPEMERRLRESLNPALKLEVWDERFLFGLVRDQLGITITTLDPDSLHELREAVDRAKGFYAFGQGSMEKYVHHPLHAQLIWHLGFWRVKKLREERGFSPRDILPPGLYRKAIVVVADMCGFSGYVRATEDERIIRDNLTAFYSKARYQIINSGGLFYQFVGDEVIAVFGIPDRSSADAERALETAQRLLEIGLSISMEWQRQINLIQPVRGFHLGINIGDLQIVSLRPFSRSQMGAVGDNINTAARLMSVADPNEIVISNAFRNCLTAESQRIFSEMAPIEAKNIGSVRAWKNICIPD
jgi:class 3 adenylate cyclase